MAEEPGSPDDFAKAMEGRRYERKPQPEAGGDIARLLGVVFLGTGIFSLYTWVIGPLRDAAAGAARIDYGGKIVLVIPFVLGAGLLLVLFGNRAAEIVDKDSDSKLRWVAIALVVIGLVLAIWLDQHLRALGYSR